MRAHVITQTVKTRKLNLQTHLSNHCSNGISLHFVGFELFKKVLLVALGIWLSILFKMFLIHVLESCLVYRYEFAVR